MMILELTRGYFTILDDEDYERFAGMGWWAQVGKEGSSVYAVKSISRGSRKAGNKRLHLHRLILGLGEGQEADHINRDTLDNRRSNLRVATRTQNIWNRSSGEGFASPFKGVSRRKSGKWVARITINGKRVSLGYFWSEEEAAKAYDRAALENFGEFAYLNFTKVNKVGS